VFEASQFLGEHVVEGVGDHGEDHIEVNLEQDGEESALRWKNLTASEMTFSTRHRRA